MDTKMLLGFLKKVLVSDSALRERKRRAGSLRGRILQIIAKGRVSHKDGGQPRDITVGDDMNEVATLGGAKPREILQAVIEEKVPATMSYLSMRKWHVCNVLLTELGASRLNARLFPRKWHHPINIQIDQPVGISLKHRYGKFIFETKVIDFEPPLPAISRGQPTSGGVVILAVPDRIEVVQRLSYFRVDVPKSLKVNVMLWHRQIREPGQVTRDSSDEPRNYWRGKLIDISADGAQVTVERSQKPDFEKEQFVGLRFTPMPYETPLQFCAQIRNTLPTADAKTMCLGLRIVGLEASSEGRQVLTRLVKVAKRYYQINQSGASQQDMQGSQQL